MWWFPARQLRRWNLACSATTPLGETLHPPRESGTLSALTPPPPHPADIRDHNPPRAPAAVGTFTSKASSTTLSKNATLRDSRLGQESNSRRTEELVTLLQRARSSSLRLRHTLRRWRTSSPVTCFHFIESIDTYNRGIRVGQGRRSLRHRGWGCDGVSWWHGAPFSVGDTSTK